MLTNVPLTLAPLIVYNLVAFNLFGVPAGDPWTQPVFTVQMISDGRFTMLLGDLLVTGAIVILLIEVLKATRRSSSAIIDHLLSTIVFVVYLVEFITVRQAATSVFFILLVVAFIDVIAGYTVTIRNVSRDVHVGPGDAAGF